MHPKVIEAAHGTIDTPICTNERRARRVLLAQAEHVSEGMVAAAMNAFVEARTKPHSVMVTEAMRLAIAAALKHEAGESQ